MDVKLLGEKLKEGSVGLSALTEELKEHIQNASGGGRGTEKTIILDLNELLYNNGFNVEYNNNFIEEFFKDANNTTILVGAPSKDEEGRDAGFQTVKTFPIAYVYPQIGIGYMMAMGPELTVTTIVLNKDNEPEMISSEFSSVTNENLGAALQYSKTWEFNETLTHDLTELIQCCPMGGSAKYYVEL